MLPFPFGDRFQALQPLVFLANEVLIKSQAASTECVLRTAAGVTHPLGTLGRFDSIWRNALQGMLPSTQQFVSHELPRRVAELSTSPLAYFTEFLVPAFRERDFSEASDFSECSAPRPVRVDWTDAVVSAAKNIPAPEFVWPSVWVFGRVWKLHEQPIRKGCWQVITPKGRYALSGDFYLLNTLVANWHNAVSKYVSEVAARFAQQAGSDTDYSALGAATRQLQVHGFVEYADLLFLPGSPPRLGHLIPAHYNRALQRQVNRDLAMTAPLTVPPTAYPSKSLLTVCERRATGWSAVSLPHGLCLGPDPPTYPQASPGVGLAAFLRWAAERIAENGVFHSSDDADTTNDYNYDYNY